MLNLGHASQGQER
uniref:Uncharacterized protein n=1 Tax=Moniliophthora roreri TaxID=221103 RepID=A0A0W0FIR9_MONRR